MNLSLLRYEARRCGPATLLLPLLAAAAIAGISTAAIGARGGPHTIGITMVRLVGDVFPVTVGLAAASALARERAVELQLTLDTSYATTVARRLSLVLVVSTIGAGIAVAIAEAQGHWTHPAHGVMALLVPLGPGVMLSGAAAWAAVVARSGGAASSLVIAAWLVQILMLDRFVGVWEINRVFLIGLGVFAWVVASRRLTEGEQMVQGGAE